MIAEQGVEPHKRSGASKEEWSNRRVCMPHQFLGELLVLLSVILLETKCQNCLRFSNFVLCTNTNVSPRCFNIVLTLPDSYILVHTHLDNYFCLDNQTRNWLTDVTGDHNAPVMNTVHWAWGVITSLWCIRYPTPGSHNFPVMHTLHRGVITSLWYIPYTGESFWGFSQTSSLCLSL